MPQLVILNVRERHTAVEPAVFPYILYFPNSFPFQRPSNTQSNCKPDKRCVLYSWLQALIMCHLASSFIYQTVLCVASMQTYFWGTNPCFVVCISHIFGFPNKTQIITNRKKVFSRKLFQQQWLDRHVQPNFYMIIYASPDLILPCWNMFLGSF